MKRTIYAVAGTLMAVSLSLSTAVASERVEKEHGASRRTLCEVRAVKENYSASLRLDALKGKKHDEKALEKVSPDKVNMVTNHVSGKAQQAVEVDGKKYYVSSDEYASTLWHNQSLRYARDPMTGRLVDKAASDTYADASGRVLYFESEGSYKGFLDLYSSLPEEEHGHRGRRHRD